MHNKIIPYELKEYLIKNSLYLGNLTRSMTTDDKEYFYDILCEVYELGKQEGIKG